MMPLITIVLTLATVFSAYGAAYTLSENLTDNESFIRFCGHAIIAVVCFVLLINIMLGMSIEFSYPE